ncbi:E3 ubiquitin-protein ligase TRIM39-like [Sphaerodactylus townsendi]|uniref:E3 ubiquitin-protein ligase TRIM39-like n=1 Tax=Sphaerodactylus townsendi TaxID=933632 RepID=UPI0020273976|nr:E3 ubiquitin-protein ligase TRIM39-like [Sphaerodactylus townsendi]
MMAGKERVCQMHQQPLKLFCKEDEALICLDCDRSKEHRDHETLPLETASQEYKDQFCNHLKILKEERERIVGCKADLMEESQDLLVGARAEEALALVETNLTLAGLGTTRSSTPDPGAGMAGFNKATPYHVAARASSACVIVSIPRNWAKAGTERTLGSNPVNGLGKSNIPVIDHVIQGAYSLWIPQSILETHWIHETPQASKNVNADVTLDPDTAHPRLILSADGKSVRQGEEAQAVPNNPERFNSYYAVLGREGFTGGRHFWEVLVGSEGGWWVGVARKSVKRKGWLNFSPEEGIWALEKYEGNYLAAKEGFNLPLTLSGEPKRIRVCLNYDGGQVAFFDADRAALMYKYSGASFSGETLLPYFYVYKKGHLRLC